MSGQSVAASVERLQAIEDSRLRVLGEKRSWLTPEEFLAKVEEYRREYDRERLNPKPINHEPAKVVDYRLKPYVTFNRQLEFKHQEVGR
jgi:hypothetical protein